jgi:DNA-directed RNA polymerase subunit RPC12/RpoP
VVLWKLGDPRGELLVHTALWRGAVGVRRTVAEELAKVGDERSMKSLVNRLGSGDEPDEPIRESLVRHSNACSIRLLCGALDYNKRSVRLSAAKVLISLAESRPELIGDAWERIRSRVTNRHIDKTEHRDKRNGSTDCYSYMEHTDYPDIGLSFPERPTPLRQVQSAVPVPCPGQVMTLSCPACGRPVDVPIDTAGNTFSCPVCMAPFQLPREPNAKSASARKSGSPRAPEMISAVCPNPRCRKRVKTSARNAGRAARCPNCGTVFRLQSDVGIDVNPDF